MMVVAVVLQLLVAGHAYVACAAPYLADGMARGYRPGEAGMRATMMLTLATLAVANVVSATSAAMTLQRPYDPVEVSTGRLVKFPSRESRCFRLYRFTGTTPIAIRHQFDP